MDERAEKQKPKTEKYKLALKSNESPRIVSNIYSCVVRSFVAYGICVSMCIRYYIFEICVYIYFNFGSISIEFVSVI